MAATRKVRRAHGRRHKSPLRFVRHVAHQGQPPGGHGKPNRHVRTGCREGRHRVPQGLLGILVVADISTFGWLISNVEGAIALLLWGAVIAVAALSIGILLLHRRIKRDIQSLREL